MKLIKLYTIICISLCSSSCFSDFDELNPNEVAVSAHFDTLDDTQLTLYSVYNALYNDNLLAVERLTLCTDMGYPGYPRNTLPTNDMAPFYTHTYVDSNTYIESKWSALYTGIFRANQVIEGLNILLGKGYTQNENWTEQMAQARFFRGLFHFYLHSVFNNGSVIIFDFVPTTTTEYAQPLSPADEVQEFFRKDLLYAYENLPVNYDGSKDYRVTRAAAATNLATSYLYSEQYDEALILLSDIINNPDYDYELVDDMDLLFTTAGEFNDESIFEINYSLGIHSELTQWNETSPTNRLGKTSTTSSFTLPCWIAVAYQDEVMDMSDERNITGYESDGTPIVRTMPLRGSAMVATKQDDDTPYYLDPITSVKVVTSESNAVGFYRKYSNWDIIDNENNLPDGSGKSGKNVVVNRLAEVYLMYAECMIEKGNISEALKYMNLIRRRWALQLLGTPAQNPEFETNRSYDGITYTQETLRTQLREVDRPLELSAEGHALRFIDLRRWGEDYAENRYEWLAEQIYHLADRDDLVNAGNSWIQPGASDKDVPSPDPDMQDYTYSSYNKSKSYWPIPLIEQQANGNLYK